MMSDREKLLKVIGILQALQGDMARAPGDCEWWATHCIDHDKPRAEINFLRRHIYRYDEVLRALIGQLNARPDSNELRN
jgi:hypothetical protein